MDTTLYYLKHKDISVAQLYVDDGFAVTGMDVLDSAHMPFMGNTSIEAIRHWLEIRAVPSSREDVGSMLKDAGCESTKELLFVNRGLSLSDCYWLEKADEDMPWSEVNLYNASYDAHFFDQTDVIFSGNATLGGNIPKEWKKDENGKWMIYKYSEEKNITQAINEGFASRISKAQGVKKRGIEYVDYSIPDEGASFCICEAFTNEHLELVSAYECIGLMKKQNDISYVEAFKTICVKNGLKKTLLDDFMDYLFMLDFSILNTDRHLNNIGILRDPDTLQFVSVAPVFDNGNSMSYQTSIHHDRVSSLEQKVTGFYDRADKYLLKVNNTSVFDPGCLPSMDQVFEIYKYYGVNDVRSELIAHNFEVRRKMIEEFCGGQRISLYNEKKKQQEQKKSTKGRAPKEIRDWVD